MSVNSITAAALYSHSSAQGFNWLDERAGDIVARSDVDENEVIDFEEFATAAPKTLRTNLIKLAKQNGNDLGFLI